MYHETDKYGLLNGRKIAQFYEVIQELHEGMKVLLSAGKAFNESEQRKVVLAVDHGIILFYRHQLATCCRSVRTEGQQGNDLQNYTISSHRILGFTPADFRLLSMMYCA